MNELILELERLTDEAKALGSLVFALQQASESDSLDNYKDGLWFVATALYRNGEALEKVWKEMHELEKANYISK